MIGRKFDYSLKIVVVGDSGVGKTCFLIRYVQDNFEEDTQPTLGVEFLSKIVQSETHRIQLQLWDTAGQEVFRSVTKGYYRGSAGALIIFDLTNRDSFTNVERWLRDVKDVALDVVPVLIGNKSDLVDKRQIKTEEAQAFADLHDMEYFETSAKIDESVSKAVEACVAKIEEKINKTSIKQMSDSIDVENAELKNPGCGC